ncbi:hypothetical protein GCM10010954_05890 [Halobacillus andaensis]|uniref:Uncharacterized protein n=1 Tax=Halobacillus andaensis TaxID=1176239 RepID=A0A917AZX1_HALAA|nr:hypothetical protein [Halobacillus andaensis]MBP2003378.1 hypothetical protein [Halobacillus andaensis]GGF10184.1 hypothetical protein GCM10010954_05890 [Halobacillus andaensis]
MKQGELFDFVGENLDPLYNELEKLAQGTPSVMIANYKIRKNSFGIFEIEGDGVFDCASSLEQCYKYLRLSIK